MNLVNVVITRQLSPVPDWVIKADVTDELGTVLTTFGVDGTSLNTWWNAQTEDFQLEYVRIFMSIMATQMVAEL